MSLAAGVSFRAQIGLEMLISTRRHYDYYAHLTISSNDAMISRIMMMMMMVMTDAIGLLRNGHVTVSPEFYSKHSTKWRDDYSAKWQEK